MKKSVLLGATIMFFSFAGYAQDKSQPTQKKPPVKKAVNATKITVRIAEQSLENEPKKIHLKKQSVKTRKLIQRVEEK